MNVSIIVATYNNVPWLEMILIMLSQQTYRDFEVLIADDGSNAENVSKTKELMNNFPLPIRHIWHEDKGWRKDKILNEAVIAAKADYLIFLDGDCIPGKCFVEDYMSLRQRGIVDAGRRVQLTDAETSEITPEKVRNGYINHLFYKCLFSGRKHAEDILYIKNSLLRQCLHADKKGGILGCNFGLYKSDLLLVNGFDEDYLHPGYGEDCDLEARLSRAGVSTIRHRFVCHVYHRKHKSALFESKENIQHFERNERNQVIVATHGINQHHANSL